MENIAVTEFTNPFTGKTHRRSDGGAFHLPVALVEIESEPPAIETEPPLAPEATELVFVSSETKEAAAKEAAAVRAVCDALSRSKHSTGTSGVLLQASNNLGKLRTASAWADSVGAQSTGPVTEAFEKAAAAGLDVVKVRQGRKVCFALRGIGTASVGRAQDVAAIYAKQGRSRPGLLAALADMETKYLPVLSTFPALIGSNGNGKAPVPA